MTSTTTGRDHVGRVELAEVLQRRHQARDADGKAGGRHRLAAEARDQAVIAPAAADRAEAHDLAVLVGDLGEQFGLVDGAGVVFEAAHDGGVDPDAVRRHSRPPATSAAICVKFVDAFAATLAFAATIARRLAMVSDR